MASRVPFRSLEGNAWSSDSIGCEYIIEREHTALADEPFGGVQRAGGEDSAVTHRVLEANLLEGCIEQKLVRPGNAAHAHARDGNVATERGLPCVGQRAGGP